MSETPTKLDAKERVASHVYFASLYFITVGILYLWGYWAPFGINILEYLELSDILKATAYPIATAILMTTIGAAIGEWRMANRDHLTPGGGRDTIIGRFLRKFSSHLLVLYVGGAIALLLFGPVEKWRVLPILLSLPIYIFAQQTNFLAETIPHESPRSIVIYVLAVLPVAAYGHGTLEANKIRTARDFTYVVSELPSYPAGTDVGTQPRLIGHAGDHMFFFDPVKIAVVVGKIESGKFLILKQYETPKNITEAQATTSFNETNAGKLTPAP